MSLPKNEAWFPAKTYGYGWGPPRRWQGWTVMVIYLLALAVGVRFVGRHPGYFVGCAVALTVALVVICIRKGEAPRWRWGGKDEAPAGDGKSPMQPADAPPGREKARR